MNSTPLPLCGLDTQMPCLAGETEVVTRHGIRAIGDVVGQAELLIPTRSPYGRSSRGGFKNVEVRSFGPQQLWAVELRKGRGRKETVYATAAHPWFARRKVRRPDKANGRHNGYEIVSQETMTADLTPGEKLSPVKATKMTGSDRSGSEVPFAVAQGFVFGDGNKGRDSNRGPASAYLYGDKDQALLPYFAAHLITPEKRPDYAVSCLRVHGLPRLWKEPPPMDESRPFLLSWLAGYFAADGTVTDLGSARMSTTRLDHGHVIRSVAAVCGVGAEPITTIMRTGKGTRPTPLHSVTLDVNDLPGWFWKIPHHRERVEARQTKVRKKAEYDRLWTVERVEPTDRVEEGFCPVVPGVEAFGLSDSIMTGVG